MSLKALLSKARGDNRQLAIVVEYERVVRSHPHLIDFRDWLSAKRKWAEFENSRKKSNRQSWEQLCDWCGHHSVRNPETGVQEWRATDKAYHMMQLCNHTHSTTLLKAWWIKQYNTKKPKRCT